jgi:predicted transcriptional regulator of viral defense system
MSILNLEPWDLPGSRAAAQNDLRVMRHLSHETVKVTDTRRALGMHKNTFAKIVIRLADAGNIERIGCGKIRLAQI